METLNQMFKGMMRSERYNRFTLQPVEPAEDGEGHSEVKLSEEAEDGGSPTFRPAVRRHNRRGILILVAGALFIFIIGGLVGFFSHYHLWKPAVSCSTVPEKSTPTQMVTSGATSQSTQPVEPTQPVRPVEPVEPVEPVAPDVPLDWTDLTRLLDQRIGSISFTEALKKYDVSSRSAGSAEDKGQASSIYDTFSKLQMDPWTDVHYVQLQTQNRIRPNRVLFGSEEFHPKGYLAYSATGEVQGKLVYANYGSKDDLDAVQRKGVQLNNSVLLLRAGRISFPEQVNLSASRGAAAVLIYPDSSDYDYQTDTELYGHVHMGFGDPYTPGFPSLNNTQFPPTRSSGLPNIPAQTITGSMATALLRKLSGPEAEPEFKGTYKLGGTENVTVEVNNVLVNTEIHNVFGVVKGSTDPDQFVVLGAQRDAWGRGYAKANVGTTLLMELAKTFRDLVEKDDFRLRRSVVFASWSAGEYGNVGATEWLEAHMTSIGKKVVAYISLDGVVMGRGGFVASASPLLSSLLQGAMKEVKSPFGSKTLYNAFQPDWEKAVLRPMTMEDPSYPFLAFAGIPSISFHFISPNKENYLYYGTMLDNRDHLMYATGQSLNEVSVAAAQVAAHMALRLVHDHLLMFDVARYKGVLTKATRDVYLRVNLLSRDGRLTGVGPNWLNRARGSFNRAADSIYNDITNSDLNDPEMCRLINERLMMIERSLLSPYVSPRETPLRHLLFGRGRHTLASIAVTEDMEDLHVQLALATWNLQGCAHAMVGNIWDLDDEI